MSDFFIGLLIVFSIVAQVRILFLKNKLNSQGAAILKSMNREDLIPQLTGTITDVGLFHPRNYRKKEEG